MTVGELVESGWRVGSEPFSMDDGDTVWLVMVSPEGHVAMVMCDVPEPRVLH